MSAQSPTVVPSASPLVQAGNSERRSVDFLLSIWGDHFFYHAFDSMMIHESAEKQILKLKSEVKRMLDVNSSPLEKLILIDQIQRLGISYLFEGEIEEALEQIHQVYFERDASDNFDMNTTARLFRLFRQQGSRISCDVFDKFKDSSLGSLRESLVTDMRGLLSLYEASHLGVCGEDILEEALAFTFTHLKRFMEEYRNNESHPLPIIRTGSHSLAARIGHALKQCLWKGLMRIEARHYISIYQGEGSHSEVLLNRAKLDFNLLLKHQKELIDISRWRKELDFGRNLPFARDRVVECYFWILGGYFEPEYALACNIVTKVITLTLVMDDTYDVYGTPEELQLLTDAIERWDRGEAGQLPEYMQVFYKALLDVFDEIEEKLADKEGISYRLFYGKEAMKMQARAYFDEAKWLNQPQYIPTVRASPTIARLMDDMVPHKFEQERGGHGASALECFMKQYRMTEQQAKEELLKKVDDAWKDINEECLRPRPVPEPSSLESSISRESWMCFTKTRIASPIPISS